MNIYDQVIKRVDAAIDDIVLKNNEAFTSCQRDIEATLATIKNAQVFECVNNYINHGSKIPPTMRVPENSYSLREEKLKVEKLHKFNKAAIFILDKLKVLLHERHQLQNNSKDINNFNDSKKLRIALQKIDKEIGEYAAQVKRTHGIDLQNILHPHAIGKQRESAAHKIESSEDIAQIRMPRRKLGSA